MNYVNIHDTELMYYRFGPIIAQYKLNSNFINELNKRGNRTHLDHSTKLAGHILKENKFDIKDKEWFLDNIKELFSEYIQTLQNYSFDRARPSIKNINLEKLWINFMKNGEFNPAHTHAGDLSFVIYTSVPDEILIENKSFKGAGSGPGCISFFYGENSNNYISEYSFVPKTGNIFIFPASLRHYVAPFKSKVTRISVSGNLVLN